MFALSNGTLDVRDLTVASLRFYKSWPPKSKGSALIWKNQGSVFTIDHYADQTCGDRERNRACPAGPCRQTPNATRRHVIIYANNVFLNSVMLFGNSFNLWIAS
jgi:hypothetical protein